MILCKANDLIVTPIPPQRASSGEAGIDFFIPKDYFNYHELPPGHDDIGPDYHVIRPGEAIKIGTGWRVLIDDNKCLVQMSRSGLGHEGLMITSPLIDKSYTGEIHITVRNVSRNNMTLKNGQKIVQFVHLLCDYGELNFIDELQYDNIAKARNVIYGRGSNGFGSTNDNIPRTPAYIDSAK